MTIELFKNENPYLPADNILQAAEKGLEVLNRYSKSASLNALKKQLGKYNNISPDRIVLSHGSDLLLREVINIFSNDRNIIRFSPSFFHVSINQSIKLINIKLSPPDFTINSGLLLSQLNEPTLIVIDNPNNPTGKLMLNDNLVEKILQNKNVLLLVDEAYYEFSGKSFVNLIEKYPNLAITRTMDKAFSLAGLRFGYLLMGDYFKEHFKDFPSYLATPSIFAAIEALKNKEYMVQNVKKILFEVKKIEDNLLKIGIQYFSGHANFILVKTEIPDFAIKLKKAGVLVRDLSDEWLNGYYRISVGLPEENEILLSMIKKIKNNT